MMKDTLHKCQEYLAPCWMIVVVRTNGECSAGTPHKSRMRGFVGEWASIARPVLRKPGSLVDVDG